jgi:hypothetical protein
LNRVHSLGPPDAGGRSFQVPGSSESESERVVNPIGQAFKLGCARSVPGAVRMCRPLALTQWHRASACGTMPGPGAAGPDVFTSSESRARAPRRPRAGGRVRPQRLAAGAAAQALTRRDNFDPQTGGRGCCCQCPSRLSLSTRVTEIRVTIKPSRAPGWPLLTQASS